MMFSYLKGYDGLYGRKGDPGPYGERGPPVS